MVNTEETPLEEWRRNHNDDKTITIYSEEKKKSKPTQVISVGERSSPLKQRRDVLIIEAPNYRSRLQILREKDYENELKFYVEIEKSEALTKVINDFVGKEAFTKFFIAKKGEYSEEEIKRCLREGVFEKYEEEEGCYLIIEDRCSFPIIK